MSECHHTISDSISVCKECGITLRMVNALKAASLISWKDVRDAYQFGYLDDVKGIGEVFLIRYLDMNFRPQSRLTERV